MLAELKGVQEMLDGLHRQVKQQLEGLDAEGLNWVPEGEEEANSLYGIALHVALAQLTIAGRISNEKLAPQVPELQAAGSIFKVKGASPDRAYELLDQAALLTHDVLNRLNEDQLEEQRLTRYGDSYSVRWWALHMIDHIANHLGHMELTRQLYLSRNKK